MKLADERIDWVFFGGVLEVVKNEGGGEMREGRGDGEGGGGVHSAGLS